MTCRASRLVLVLSVLTTLLCAQSSAAAFDAPVVVGDQHTRFLDVLDFDGPNLYNYAWSGKLVPIGSCVPASLRRDLLPSILRQGAYANQLWGIGTFESGLGLYVPAVDPETSRHPPPGRRTRRMDGR